MRSPGSLANIRPCSNSSLRSRIFGAFPPPSVIVRTIAPSSSPPSVRRPDDPMPDVVTAAGFGFVSLALPPVRKELNIERPIVNVRSFAEIGESDAPSTPSLACAESLSLSFGILSVAARARPPSSSVAARGRASAAAFLSFFRRKLPNIERPIVFVRRDAVISPSPSSSSPTSLSVDFLRAWGSLRLNVPCFEGPSDIAAARRKGSELRARAAAER